MDPLKPDSRLVLPRGNSAWICLFTPETWEIAKGVNYSWCAFTAAAEKPSKRIRKGDILFAYVTKRMTIPAMLLAEDEAHCDPASDLFGNQGRFPWMLRTSPAIVLSSTLEVKLSEHFFRISIFRGLRDGKYWPACLRISPKSIRAEDCAYLSALLQENSQRNNCAT